MSMDSEPRTISDRTKRLVVVPFLAVLMLVTGGLFLYNASAVATSSPELGRIFGTGVRVKTSPVVSRKYEDTFGATGEAGPSKSLPVRKMKGAGSDLAQRIERVYAEVGDYVDQGDLLISFDVDALGNLVEAQQGGRSALQRDLAELENREGYRRDELRAAVRTAESNVKAAKSTLARDQADLERYERMYEEGLVARFDFEQRRSKRDTSEFNLRQAEEELLRRRNELADLEARLASERQRLIAADREKASTLLAVEDDLENAQYRARFPGLVIEVPVTEGETVMPGEPLLKLGQIDPIHVLARVSQELVDRVFVGMQTEVVFDALPYATFEGEVIHIDPAIDRGSATFKTTISISNTDHRVRPGMSGFVRFQNQKTALVIPQPAVTGSGSDTAVFVAENGIAKLRHVRIGEVVDVGFVEVLGGVDAGEEVVIHGLKDLQDGDTIRVVEE